MGKITRMQILYPLMQWKPHSCILNMKDNFDTKSKAERLKGDPYIGVCFQALETLGRLCLIQDKVN